MAYKKFPAARELQKELDQKKIHQLYLMLGEEEGEKDKCISIINRLTIPDDEERRSTTGRFHLDSDQLIDAVDFALSSSMFSSNRVCIIRNLEGFKSNKENRQLFSDLFSSLPESTCLIMTTTKNRPPDFIPSDMLEKIKVFQFWRHFDSDIFRYVHASLQQKGIIAEDKAINLLIARTGKDIKKIDEAIEMLYYSGQEGPLTAAEVENYITDVKDVSIYEFVDALFLKHPGALRLYKKIYEDGIPEGRIFYEINKNLDQLEKYYFLVNNGAGIDDALKECGIYSRNKDKFISFTRNYTEENIKALFPLLGRSEVKRKSSQISKKLISSPVFELVTTMIRI